MKKACEHARNFVVFIPNIKHKKQDLQHFQFPFEQTEMHFFRDFFHETVDLYFKQAKEFLFDYFPNPQELGMDQDLFQLHQLIESKGKFYEKLVEKKYAPYYAKKSGRMYAEITPGRMEVEEPSHSDQTITLTITPEVKQEEEQKENLKFMMCDEVLKH